MTVIGGEQDHDTAFAPDLFERYNAEMRRHSARVRQINRRRRLTGILFFALLIALVAASFSSCIRLHPKIRAMDSRLSDVEYRLRLLEAKGADEPKRSR